MMTFRTILLGVAGCLSVSTTLAQLPASTVAQNKNAVLEELTGIYCYWCPDGHKTAHNIQTTYPAGNVVVINYHNTGLSTPVGGTNDPNYITADGADAIGALPGGGAVTGIPAGAVNRHIWPGQSLLFTNRNYWAGFVATTVAQPSYVNLALEGSLDVATRILTVTVQAYYTGNSPAAGNKLTVMLLEDSVRGYQGGALDNYPAQTNPDGSYWHHNLLRKILTLPAGEAISPATAGTLISKTYTFTIPQQFKNTVPAMGRLKLAAFITESDNIETVTGAYGPIVLSGFAHTRDAALVAVNTPEGEACAGKVTPEISIYNNGSMPVTAVALSYNVNGGMPQSYTYTGYIAPATFKHKVRLPQISFAPVALNTLSVTVSSVNGNTDQNAGNNNGSRDSIRYTSYVAYDTVLKMEYTQQDFHNGSHWKLYEETSNTLVAEDGPFPDVPYMVTAVRSKTFTVKPDACYQLVLENDRNAASRNQGIGPYKLFAGSTLFLESYGAPSEAVAYSWFRTSGQSVGIGHNPKAVQHLSLYPNPAREATRLSFNLASAGKVNVVVYNTIGEQVFCLKELHLAAGMQSIAIPTHNLAAGMYSIHLQTAAGTAVARCSVIH